MAENLPTSHTKQIESFLQKATARARLAFIIDATMSREGTWDAASQLQAQMFAEAAKIGGLEIQLVYFRGTDECSFLPWTPNAGELQRAMGRVRCEAGYTKYLKALEHVRKEHGRQKINAVVLIGDAMEEIPQQLYDVVAGLGVPLFCFQEGDLPEVTEAFKEMARLTNGAYARFDSGAAKHLGELLRAVAAFAVGGLTALADQHTDSARKLLGQMKK
jgi:Mg-chelatase subunit ChlD